MHYDEFKKLIQNELFEIPAGLTWVQHKTVVNLSYDRPFQTWIMQMEQEIGLSRVRETQRSYVWRILHNKQEL